MEAFYTVFGANQISFDGVLYRLRTKSRIGQNPAVQKPTVQNPELDKIPN